MSLIRKACVDKAVKFVSTYFYIPKEILCFIIERTRELESFFSKEILKQGIPEEAKWNQQQDQLRQAASFTYFPEGWGCVCVCVLTHFELRLWSCFFVFFASTLSQQNIGMLPPLFFFLLPFYLGEICFLFPLELKEGKRKNIHLLVLMHSWGLSWWSIPRLQLSF